MLFRIYKWLVLQKQTLTINDLNTKIHWFYGKDSKRFAIHMEFLAKGTISEQEWIPGYAYDGTLCFYKGVGLCRRAMFKETNISQDTFIPDFCTDFKEAAEIYRKAITENPFSENIPILIKDVTFAKNGNQYYLSDINENTVPVKVEEEVAIDILSITGGGSFAVSVLANADCWEIMSTWYNDFSALFLLVWLDVATLDGFLLLRPYVLLALDGVSGVASHLFRFFHFYDYYSQLPQ